MNHFFKSIIAIALCACGFWCHAANPSIHKDDLIRNINRHLTTLNESSDSLPPLLNLFDIEQAYGKRATYDSLARVIYGVSVRSGKSSTALEMLRHITNSASCTPVQMRNALKETKRFQGHQDHKATEAFIKMRLNRYYANNVNPDSTQAQFQRLLKQLTVNPSTDIYENIVMLHAVCMYLSNEHSRELLPKYFDKLYNLVDSVDDRTLSLKSTVLLQSSLAYSAPEAALYNLSIAADRKLVALMDTMDKQYEAAGRPFRDYGNSKFMAYRRMLSNWRDLSPFELESIYKKVQDILETAPVAKEVNDSNPLTDIFYLMGTGNYATAKPLIEKALLRNDNQNRHSELVRDMMLAAKETGDKDTYMRLSEEYIDDMNKLMQTRLQERYKELQAAYDINSYKSEISTLMSEKKSSHSNFQRIVIAISIGALLVLLILLFFLVRQYAHTRKLSANLADSNKALVKESETLRASKDEITKMRDEAQQANQFKTSFLRNLGREISVPLNSIVEHSRLIADCADAANKPYLATYAEMIQFNGDYITTILNDVLHLAQLDANSLDTARTLVDLRKIAELVCETISTHLNTDVKIRFDEDSVNPLTYTDPRRVQQILMNVMSNAVKFTSSGTITLQCNFVNQGKTIAISVTDTGIGIDPKYRDQIFERFVKLNPNSTGAGLGLPIARMLARLLGGDLSLDTNYNKGARFVFTIPYTTK